MGLIAVPNVSEGRDPARIRALVRTMEEKRARVADVHTDPTHNRTVFTVGGSDEALLAAMTGLAGELAYVDLTRHTGVHPRLGGLDVCPFVPHGAPLERAVALAVATGSAIATEWGLPVYLYGAAARRDATRELPELRRGGLTALRRRALEELPPDFGPHAIDERRGVVCVGAREPLIAFNVWIDGSQRSAEEIARRLRQGRSRLPGLRVLGLSIDDHRSQVSMNLTDPEATGIDRAYEAVVQEARDLGVRIAATEIVGVPPTRFMPDPGKEAARLLKKPGRSLETALSVR